MLVCSLKNMFCCYGDKMCTRNKHTTFYALSSQQPEAICVVDWW